MNTIYTKNRKMSSLLLLLALLLGLSAAWATTAQTAGLPAETCTYDSLTNTRSCELWATSGTLDLPGGASVPIWGYANTAGEAAALPGPALVANQGENLEVILHNGLSESTSLLFAGQGMATDLTGVAAGGTTTYTFGASQAGTFLYEAGLLPNSQHQTAMGMFGALIVRPAGAPGQAYADASSAFDDEALVVLSEVDPALNNSADPAAFDMRDYKPQYWLINGKSYPQTDAIPSTAGNTVLLRYINAGLLPHSMGVLGLDQTLLASDGIELPYSRKVVVQNIAPGQTMDMLVGMPATVPAGGGNYALYDTNLLLHNNGAAGFGGMMTFITLADGTLPGTGPSTTSVSLSPNSTTSPTAVSLSATIPGATSAEYFIDVQGASGSGSSMSPGAGTDEWIATLSTAGLSTGDHTIYVHGSDGTIWGAFNFAVLHLDNDGPMTKALVLSPNPSNGIVPVTLTATGDDTMSGGSNIAAAEYFIDAPGADGSALNMSVNQSAPIASLNATLPAGLAAGMHTVYVHSQDTFGHWGPFATVDLIVDTGGPTASNVMVTPDLLYSRVAVQVDATLTDVDNVKKAEGFIDTPGTSGTGFPLTPRDGLFNEPSEDAYATIPFATINALSPGVHTVYVHGMDSSGNWGDFGSAIFEILPEQIFADSFETGLVPPWSSVSGSNVTIFSPSRTANGMQVALDAVTTTGFVTDASPIAEPSYRARFYFNPNGMAPGNNAAYYIILAGFDSANPGQEVFHIEYRRRNAGGGAYEVRGVVTRSDGTTSATSWFAINNNAWNSIEISWQSGTAASFNLYINGVLRQSLTGLNTVAWKVGSVVLGPSGGTGTGTGTMYFDDFVSKRNTYIGP